MDGMMVAARDQASDGLRGEAPAEDVAAAALSGLTTAPKTLPPKLFYDEAGCALFGRITALPEYYVTRTEVALLPEVAAEVGAGLPPGAVLVEYGASDEGKALVMLDAMRDPAAYVPIDIAGGALAAIVARMARSRPDLPVRPVEGDFLAPLALPLASMSGMRLGFFPGSTIGNLEPLQARQFLADARAMLGRDSAMLVGVDLRKDPAVLIPAYDDAAGVTAAFNRNVLARLNREAGGDFDLGTFVHRADWNPLLGRVEMHLVSLRDQVVHVAGHAIGFRRGESIHTESSYKHTRAGFAAIAAAAGWRVTLCRTDAAEMVSLQLLEPAS